MAKRFTDSDKWKKPFLRGLKAPYKLLWFYIWDECDHAGLWQVDFEVAQIKIGEKVKIQDAAAAFGNRIVPVENGELWFVPEFVEFQYGDLAENNRAHTKIIFLLRKYGLIGEDLKIKEAPYKPLISPLQGDKEEVKEMDKEKEKEKVAPQLFLEIPWGTETFKTAWEYWRTYKKKTFKFEYKDINSEQAALKKLSTLSGGIEGVALEIIQESMANGWQGFFALKNNQNGQQTGNKAADQAQRTLQILHDRANGGNR